MNPEGDPRLNGGPRPPDKLDRLGPVDPYTLVGIIAASVGRWIKEHIFRRQHPTSVPTSKNITGTRPF